METQKKQETPDLGKWNKIKFLGLEGNSSDGASYDAIPHNVKQ